MEGFFNPFRYSQVRPDFLNGSVRVEIGTHFDPAVERTIVDGTSVVPVSEASLHQLDSNQAAGWLNRHNALTYRDFQERERAQAPVQSSPDGNVEALEEIADLPDDAEEFDNVDWVLRGHKLFSPDPQKAAHVLATRLHNPMTGALIHAEFAHPNVIAAAQKSEAIQGVPTDAWRRLAGLHVARDGIGLTYGVYDRTDGVFQDSFEISVPLIGLAEFLGFTGGVNPQDVLVKAAEFVRAEMFPSQLRVAGDTRFSDVVQLGNANYREAPAVDWGDQNSMKEGLSETDSYPGLIGQAVIRSSSSEGEVGPQELIRVNLEDGLNGQYQARIIIERPKTDKYGPTLALRGRFRDFVASRLEQFDAPAMVTTESQGSLEDLFR